MVWGCVLTQFLRWAGGHYTPTQVYKRSKHIETPCALSDFYGDPEGQGTARDDLSSRRK
jgi:hypothetical protein